MPQISPQPNYPDRRDSAETSLHDTRIDLRRRRVVNHDQLSGEPMGYQRFVELRDQQAQRKPVVEDWKQDDHTIRLRHHEPTIRYAATKIHLAAVPGAPS